MLCVRSHRGSSPRPREKIRSTTLPAEATAECCPTAQSSSVCRTYLRPFAHTLIAWERIIRTEGRNPVGGIFPRKRSEHGPAVGGVPTRLGCCQCYPTCRTKQTVRAYEERPPERWPMIFPEKIPRPPGPPARRGGLMGRRAQPNELGGALDPPGRVRGGSALEKRQERASAFAVSGGCCQECRCAPYKRTHS